MQARSYLSVPRHSRPTTVHSSRPSSHNDSSEDHHSDSCSDTFLPDTDSGSSRDPEPHTGIQPGAHVYDPAHESSGGTSSTCVSGTHPSRLLEAVEPPHSPSPSCSSLTPQHGDMPRRSPADRLYMPIIRNWKWEILSMVTSLGLIDGIIIMLGNYNFSEQPKWPYHVNINSLVSVMTAVIVAQLGFILAEIISQLKWSWFRHPHLLQDLDEYDAASRGMIGSLTFLGRFARHPRAYLAVSAAFILSTLAAIGPFTQQSIKSYACQRALHNTTAWIPAVNWINSSLIAGTGTEISNLEMKFAALEGMVGSADDSRQVAFDCPTGNCDFDTYSSLAYCSSCEDTTPYIQEAFGPDHHDPERFYWNYTLRKAPYSKPQGTEYCQLKIEDVNDHASTDIEGRNLDLAAPWLPHFIVCDGNKTAQGPAEGIDGINFRILSMSWANCSSDHEDGMPDNPGCGLYPEQLISLANSSGLIAMTCNFGLCVRDYTARVRNGVLDERTTGSFFARYINWPETLREFKLPCIVDKINYDRSNISQVPKIPGRDFTTVGFQGELMTLPRECIYETEMHIPMAIAQFLEDELFHPRYSSDDTERGCELFPWDEEGICEPWYLGRLFRKGRLTAETISADMDSIARSISNRMRAVGSNAYRNGSGFAQGTVIQTTVCVKVEWPWLILPVTLVLLTGALFLWVLITARHAHVTNGHPIWKSSATAAFFHGINVRSETPDATNERNAGHARSKGEPENFPGSTSPSRPDAEVRLMSIGDMQARAKRTTVKLETAAPGRRGFILVNEEQDGHCPASQRQHGQRHLAGSHLDGETLPLTEPPSQRTVSGQLWANVSAGGSGD